MNQNVSFQPRGDARRGARVFGGRVVRAFPRDRVAGSASGALRPERRDTLAAARRGGRVGSRLDARQASLVIRLVLRLRDVGAASLRAQASMRENARRILQVTRDYLGLGQRPQVA